MRQPPYDSSSSCTIHHPLQDENDDDGDTASSLFSEPYGDSSIWVQDDDEEVELEEELEDKAVESHDDHGKDYDGKVLIEKENMLHSPSSSAVVAAAVFSSKGKKNMSIFVGTRRRRRSELQRLQAKFARRDHILSRISQGKSRAFVELLRRHEQEVQCQCQEKLMMLQTQPLASSSSSSTPSLAQPQTQTQSVPLSTVATTQTGGANNTSTTTTIPLEIEVKAEKENQNLSKMDDQEAWFASTPETPPKARLGGRGRSLQAFVLDFITYELNTTAPAVFAFLLLTILEYSVWELVASVSKYVYTRFNSVVGSETIAGIIFIIGLCLLRLSGTLYQWLNISDYNCVKFEFHNRLRQGKWDARALQWLYKHLFLRFMMYTVGYYLCFYAVIHFHFRFAQLWSEREALLQDLPSRKYDLNVCLANYLEPFSCQAAVDLMKERSEALMWADKVYTYNVMSARSYEAYWLEGDEGLGKDGMPLVSQTRELLLIVGAGAIAVAGLRWYGLAFWLMS